MAELDYTTAIEVDPGSDLTITSDTIDVSTLDRDELTWVYWDEGVGGISSTLERTVQVKQESATASFLLCAWSLADELAGFVSRPLANNQCAVYATSALGADRIQIALFYRSNSITGSDTSIELSNNTDYWLRIVLDASTLTMTCYIYSNAAMTTLVDTITASMDVSVTFRYEYALRNYGFGAGGHSWTGYVKKLTEILSIQAPSMLPLLGVG